MKKISYLLLLTAATILPSYAQHIEKDKMAIVSKQELQGTYQLEFLKGASPVALTQDILQKINEIRDEEKDTFFMINDFCRVRIFPKNRKSNAVEEYIIVDSFN